MDPVINFGKTTVSIGYDAAATSIVLTSGHGAKLPSTFSYNLTWWNSTDYDDPADDPNVEIVRCTARSTDTLTVTRAQEGTSASTKNTAGKTYKMALCVTKKMIDDIEATIVTNKNLLINGGFSVAQQGTSFDSTTTPANNDDTYLLDDCILLSDGNDVVDVSQQSGGGISGNDDYVRLDVETVSKKFGILKIIENKDLKSIIGGVASLSFECKVTNATKLSDIRAAVIAWDGTADVVTSDIVSTWNAEGTRPTLVANWTAENTDSDLDVTTSWVKYTIENISIDTASAKNVAVFIYQNNVAANDTAGIFLEITKVKLNEGSVATDFEYRDYASELAMCQRHYWRTSGIADEYIAVGHFSTTSALVGMLRFPVTMRDIPTFTKSADSALEIHYQNSINTSTAISASLPTTGGARLSATGTGTPFTAGEGGEARIASASDYIGFSARL